MTNEEAINTLNYLKDYYNDKNEDSYVGFHDDDNEAIDMAIKALEAQPKTGYISIDVKKLAKEVAEKALDEITYEGKTIREWAEILAKQQPCEDCVSRAEVIDGIERYIEKAQSTGTKDDFISFQELVVKQLPSVTPQRPKGKWIDFNWNDGDICRWGIKCSECHTEYKHGGEMWHNPKFCPNCGAYNAENKENEDD